MRNKTFLFLATLLLVLFFTASSSLAGQDREEITVSTAMSLKNAFMEMGKRNS